MAGGLMRRPDGGATVRRLLAARTRAAHEALHLHPWIASLARPGLTHRRYRAVLGAYHGFFVGVESERERLVELPQLSLRPAITALASDAATSRRDADRDSASGVPRLPDRPALLGALYVLHGAGFGASVLNRAVRTALPDAPRAYLGSATARETWRRLEDELEAYGGDDAACRRLIDGATATFSAFGRHVSRFCEADRASLPTLDSSGGRRAAASASGAPTRSLVRVADRPL